MIEYFGPGIDKSRCIRPLETTLCRLSPGDCERVGWVVLPGKTKYSVKKEGCLVVATKNGIIDDGEVMSFIVGSPSLDEGLCYLMAATVAEFRGNHLYSSIKNKLVHECLKCRRCGVNRVMTETSNEKVKRVSFKLGFVETSDGWVLNRRVN